ncbi:MAG: cbb3-type cytochrome c oxidase subunit I [Planctomycetes bacterium]|nr:cbb3-type cytochrome c oxidase subunit I [Planctomycetota bacterium]
MSSSTDIGVAKAGSAARASETTETGLGLFTLDSNRLARMYALVMGLALVAGIFLAFGLALQPVSGAPADPEAYRRMYTMHGLALVFLVALPAIPGVLGNVMLPRLVGEEGMAWPRLNLLAFHLFATGALLFLVAFLAAPADTGWSLEVPFAISSTSGIAWSLAAMLSLACSFVCSGANVIATVVQSRRAGDGRAARSWSELPFSAWAFSAAAFVQALAAPILVVALVLLFAQRSGAADAIGASTPGADLRFDTWFWTWGHPAFGAMLLAALAVVSEVFASSAGRKNTATVGSVSALAAIVVLSFAGAGVHVLGRGASAGDDAGASALGLLTGVPFAYLVTTWLFQLAGGALRVTTGLAYGLVFLVMLCAGGMAGVFLVLPPTAAYLQNTCFATAQFHYLAVGAALVALLAGVYHVWPSWARATVREGGGMLACFLLFIGVHIAFVPTLLLGYLGQPRRTGALVAGADDLALWSAVGSALVIVAVVLAGWNLLASVLYSASDEAGKDGA